MYTDNNGRTLKVDFIDEDKYTALGKNAKTLEKESIDLLNHAALERSKLRIAEKLRAESDFASLTRKSLKSLELRTVDIKDLWQVCKTLYVYYLFILD